MTKYYGLVAIGKSVPTDHGRIFRAWNSFVETEASDKVDAFLKFYESFVSDGVDITAVRPDGETRILGFTDSEWEIVAETRIVVREGMPIGNGVQIQAIREVPFN